MSEYVSLFDIVDAISAFGSCAIFVGAGVSASANIPTAAGIIAQLARTALGGAGVNDVPAWLSAQPFYDPDEPYASTLDAALPGQADRIRYFEGLIAGARPTPAHRDIARMCHRGFCHCVLSTNFDRLMEHAVCDVCGHMPCVLATDDLPLDTAPQTGRAKVWKLHGDYLYGDIRNLGHELQATRESMHRKLEMAAKHAPMIVAGYSGGDASVMDVMEELAADGSAFPGGIFWLTHRGLPVNGRVRDVLAASGGGALAVDGSNEFFEELLSSLPERRSARLPGFGAAPHRHQLAEERLEPEVKRRLPAAEASEFLALLRRQPELEGFCTTLAALDLLLAQYEERGELSGNLARTADRYVDTLAGAYLTPASSEPPSRRQQRENQLVALGLAEVHDGRPRADAPLLQTYLGALERGELLTQPGRISESLDDDRAYELMRMQVGMLPAATDVITEAINQAAGLPGTYGRAQPWPQRFYRAASLCGACAHVQPSLIERIVDLLTLEFDTENWPPRDAIRAIASIGTPAIDQMADYLLDAAQDTFAREDAAMVLGLIGNRRVITELLRKGRGLSPRDTKFVIYALGLTANPTAVAAIAELSSQAATSSQHVITDALAGLGYQGEPVRAGRQEENASPRPVLQRGEVLAQNCPGLPGTQTSHLVRSLYSTDGPAVLQAFGRFGWPPDGRTLSVTAKSLRDAGRLWEAEIVAAEALERYPMAVGLYHDLALVYSAQKRYLSARRYYSVALGLDPGYSDFYNDFAVTMMGLANWDAARYLLVRAITLDDGDYRPWFNLANVYLLARRTVTSEPAAVIPTADGATLRLFKIADLETANLRDARICLQQALHLNPQHEWARSTLLGICEATGEPPDEIPAQQELVSALHIGELELGGIYRESAWSDATVSALRRSAECRYRGDLAGALAAAEQASSLQPQSVDILETIAMLFAALHKTAEAATVFETALRMRPTDRDLLMNYSACLTAGGRHSEAVRAAQKAIAADPSRPGAWITLAQAYLAAGNQEDARDVLMEAVRLSPPYDWSLLHAAPMCKELQISAGLLW